MPQLPLTFWPQIFARFRTKSPKLYDIIIKNSLWFTVLSVGIPFLVTEAMPGMGFPVPQWLSYSNAPVAGFFGVLAGLGIGGATVAATTIETKETPPLVSAGVAAIMPTNEELALEVERLRKRLESLESPKNNQL